jgi:hypothetical protein
VDIPQSRLIFYSHTKLLAVVVVELVVQVLTQQIKKTQVMEVLVSSLLLPELLFITVAAAAVALEISKEYYGLIYL